LAQEVEFTDNIRPICLFHPNTAQLDNPDNDFTVMGWGLTEARKPSDVLLYTTSSAVPHATCEGKYQEKLSDFELQESQLCAVGHDGKDGKKITDSCNGDSGGPLAARLEGKWYLAGLTSFGGSACNSTIPNIFSRIASFYAWIAKTMQAQPIIESFPNHPQCGITPEYDEQDSPSGQRTGRRLLVAHGQEAAAGQFPWIVSLQYKPGRGQHKCAGSLIGERQGVDC
jgi:secreted trypsin-like serine protease